MRYYIILLFLILNSQVTCQMKKHKHTNKLINETSPYLLQHAHNPVNWYPWGEEAFEKAKKENKPILISIGYAACHWCHVMERESFENEEIAKIMNDFFVCIKVDREERPDVDQIYMEAVQRLTGHGGWPLNCFVLPDGRPFFGGTYFRPDNWKNVLLQINDVYINQPAKIDEIAEEIKKGLQQSELITLPPDIPLIKLGDLQNSYNKWAKRFDPLYGGNNRAPKFPMPNTYEFLFQYYVKTKDKSVLDHIELSLKKMYMGGIYDHVGGGFARYSTDKFWIVPHFEKMLYDNAQLVSLYAHAYQLTGDVLYKNVVTKTLEFVENELSDDNGGFYSSLDADSEGVEGKYYVWNKAEIDKILGDDSNLFCDYFNIKINGNWEDGKNIIYISKDKKGLLSKYNLNENVFDVKIQNALNKLKKVRNYRIKPGLDDKILTSWNALMLKGYIDVYNALGEEKYLVKALKNAQFIEKDLRKKDGGLWRSHKNGISKIDGFLDDYSFTIEAYIKLYQSTFDEQWLMKAKDLINYVSEHFSDNNTGLFYYTSLKTNDLIVRKKEIFDNVIPASNSSLAISFMMLGKLLADTSYLSVSQTMLKQLQETLKQNLSYCSNWGILALTNMNTIYELVIVGKDALNLRKTLSKEFLPNIIILGSTKENNKLNLLKNRYVQEETYLYLCKDNVCLLPVKTIEDLLKQIRIDKEK